MIDHLGLRVADVARSKAFFTAALAPLGYTLLFEHEISGAGFGANGKPDFWIQRGDAPSPIHVALASPDRATVDAFHEAAIAAGGSCDGPPGLRPQYHPTYYGAFVIDPDGNSIEAVCHAPE